MEETFKLIGHVTSLIPYKDSSRPQRLAVVEAKSRKDAAAHKGLNSPKKVHKPPLRVNAINFELNGFNASIWVPWSPSHPKKL